MKQKYDMDQIVACVTMLCVIIALVAWLIKSHGSAWSIFALLVACFLCSGVCSELENNSPDGDCGGADV